MNHSNFHRSGLRAPRRQRGVVLLFALIALVILLLGAVALIRSFNSSLFTAGNIGFKRDMQNQSELAVAKALGQLQGSGVLSSAAARASSSAANNYVAVQLESDAHGIPKALLDDAFLGKGVTTNNITGTSTPIVSTGGVTIRYLIDRLCSASSEGKTDASLGAGSCVLGDSYLPTAVSSSLERNATANLAGSSTSGAHAVTQQSVVYRLSVRVDGPRGTQSYFQSTFTIPS